MMAALLHIYKSLGTPGEAISQFPDQMPNKQASKIGKYHGAERKYGLHWQHSPTHIIFDRKNKNDPDGEERVPFLRDGGRRKEQRMPDLRI